MVNGSLHFQTEHSAKPTKPILKGLDFLQEKWQAFEIDSFADFEFCEMVMSNYLLGKKCC